MLRSTRILCGLLLSAAALVVITAGCGRNSNPLASQGTGPLGANGVTAARAPGAYPAPTDRATFALAGENETLWPYTGDRLDGVRSDPVNLVFYGAADPVAIRDALLGVDGDRSAIGLPPVPPFNSRWTDAMGDVQTTWVEREGWTGSVIQLQLGDYAPLRFHLRLFTVRSPLPTGERWTVGAAHFEVQIPGTADHEVLSWELAEQIVAFDLGRSGLLSADNPVSQTGPINDSPFRVTRSFIYNGLPPELVALIEGPPQPVSADVPIKTDGRATVLHLAGRAASAGDRSQHFTVEFGQTVPRPLCASGPSDWIQVSGPLQFDALATVDGHGNYSFQAVYGGKLRAVPVDISQDPPAVVGEPFFAQVGDEQRGTLGPLAHEVAETSHRLVPGAGGSEFEHRFLRVSSDGGLRSDVDTRCR